MKAFHKACQSTNLGLEDVHIRKGRSVFVVKMPFCIHCNKVIEEQEVQRTDRRLSSVVTWGGKAYSHGREIK